MQINWIISKKKELWPRVATLGDSWNYSSHFTNKVDTFFFYLICLLKVLEVYSIHPYGIYFYRGPSWSWSYGSWIYNYLCLSVLTLWVWILFRPDTTLCDKLLLVTGWWFSPVSSTNKTDCQLKYCWKWH